MNQSIDPTTSLMKFELSVKVVDFIQLQSLPLG